jgi:hypothetical protein
LIECGSLTASVVNSSQTECIEISGAKLLQVHDAGITLMQAFKAIEVVARGNFPGELFLLALSKLMGVKWCSGLERYWNRRQMNPAGERCPCPTGFPLCFGEILLVDFYQGDVEYSVAARQLYRLQRSGPQRLLLSGLFRLKLERRLLECKKSRWPMSAEDTDEWRSKLMLLAWAGRQRLTTTTTATTFTMNRVDQWRVNGSNLVLMDARMQCRAVQREWHQKSVNC